MKLPMNLSPIGLFTFVTALIAVLSFFFVTGTTGKIIFSIAIWMVIIGFILSLMSVNKDAK